jgi:hypothetical protein
LVCFRLSPSCPCRPLHTFHSSRPARNYPRLLDTALLIRAPEGLEPSRSTRCSAHTTGPSDSLPAPRDFSRPALYARSLPDKAAGEGLSCSALLCPNVPPPETPKRSSIPSGPGCCLLPSP